MLRAEATRELLAAPEDVWAFLAEPHHLADWWPGVAAVEPDRRGLAPGARWTLRYGPVPGLFRRASAEGTLLVREVEPVQRAAWHLTHERLDVEIELAPAGAGRTRVMLAARGLSMLGPGRGVVRDALRRLYDLVQTAATL